MASWRIEEREKVGKNCEKERRKKFVTQRGEEKRREEERREKNRELCKGGSNGLGIE